MTKNVKGSPVTTIVGLFLLILVPVLVFFGLVTPEQKDPLQGYLEQLWAAYQSGSLVAIFTTIAGIIGLFMKDPKFLKR